MQHKGPCEHAELGRYVHTLLYPVDGCLGGVAAGEVAHTHAAHKGQYKERYGTLLFEPCSQDRKPRAYSAKAKDHHADKYHAAGKKC